MNSNDLNLKSKTDLQTPQHKREKKDVQLLEVATETKLRLGLT